MLEGNEPCGVLVLFPGRLVLGVWVLPLGMVIEDLVVAGPPLVALVFALAHRPSIAGDAMLGQPGTRWGDPPELASGEVVHGPKHAGIVWRLKALAVLHVAGLVVHGVLVRLDAGQAGRHALENLLLLGILREVLPVLLEQGCIRALHS